LIYWRPPCKCKTYWKWLIVFNATFSNISVISWISVLMVEEAGIPGENHRPWASNWKTLSLSVGSRVHPFCNLQSRARTHAVCLTFSTFSFGYCAVFSSSIYGFWWHLWCLQTLLIHAYQYNILLRLFHHFSFDSCCSYWILVYFCFVLHFSIFRCRTKRNETKYYAAKYTKMGSEMQRNEIY
jgi:hypothetical protein